MFHTKLRENNLLSSIYLSRPGVGAKKIQNNQHDTVVVGNNNSPVCRVNCIRVITIRSYLRHEVTFGCKSFYGGYRIEFACNCDETQHESVEELFGVGHDILTWVNFWVWQNCG